MAGTHKSWVIKYCILAPSIFSITNEVFSLHKKCVSALRCVIPVVCVTNEREESVVNQHN